MDLISENPKVGGDVDRDYCRRVTLAYLAKYDEQQATRKANGTQHIRE